MARDKATGGPVTICVINLKGGVGKSTITALLSRHAFNTRGKDVLAIDLDPQANLSQGLMHQSYPTFLSQKGGSIVEVFNDYLPPKPGGGGAQPLTAEAITELILESGKRRLDLIPSRFDFSDALTNAVRPDPKVLARFLAKNFKSKDLILIDCSPTESVFTTAAYHASDYVLIPVKPEFFATIGFPLLAESLANFRRSNKAHAIEVAGVVVNNAFYHGGNDGGPEKERAMRAIHKECDKNGWYIFKKQMYHSRGYPKLMRGDYSYPGDAALFWTFADEFFDHLGL
jgi:chromosome partitioning protein